MKHYDEHTIARMVLSPDADRAFHSEFMGHLQNCDGCRQVYNELKDFYDFAHDVRKSLPEGQSVPGGLVAHWEPNRPAVVPWRGVGRVTTLAWRAVARRPIVAAGGAFLSLGLLALLLFNKSGIVDRNPARFITDDNRRTVVVYNSSGQELWNLPWHNSARHGDVEINNHVAFTTLVDLDEDRKNEVVSVLPLGTNSTEEEWATLRIFRPDSVLISQRPLGHAVTFQGSNYEANLDSRALLITTSTEGESEILVAIVNRHSPSAVLRLDRNGNVLGEYWHYGHIESVKLLDVWGDKRPELLVCAMNDAKERGVLIILEPSKIRGVTEASATRGFGYPPSDAEIGYLSFPRTPFESDIHRGYPGYIYSHTAGSISIAYAREDSLLLDYVFSNSLNLISINSTDYARAQFAQFGSRSRNPLRTLDSVIADLGDSIEYWNGTKWSLNPVWIIKPQP